MVIKMAICQIMIQDFMYGWGGYKEGYSDYDLRIGLDYAESLIEDGYKKEPFHHYDLHKFVIWCKKKLKK
jgi:hypothetical protein